MATATGADYLDVFKFDHSGIVALCEEVASQEFKDFAKVVGADLDHGVYRHEHHTHYIRFTVRR